LWRCLCPAGPGYRPSHPLPQVWTGVWVWRSRSWSHWTSPTLAPTRPRPQAARLSCAPHPRTSKDPRLRVPCRRPRRMRARGREQSGHEGPRCGLPRCSSVQCAVEAAAASGQPLGSRVRQERQSGKNRRATCDEIVAPSAGRTQHGPPRLVARRAVCSNDRAGVSGSSDAAVDQVLLTRLTIAFIFPSSGVGTLVKKLLWISV
jgi:hypothetical protein